MFICSGIFLCNSIVFAEMSYEPMEEIPGTEGTDAIKTFPSYVEAVYKFAIWSVGVSALLMITIGGFFYFFAAGNTSKMQTGKKIIADALFGLIAVMVAWLILNTINPDLVTIDIDSIEDISNN